MSIFKAYDIRGIYPSELNEETAYKIGGAFVSFLKCKTVVIGRDMRLSSDSLFEAVAKGVTEQGADVIDIGLCTTPMLSFTVAHFNYECGIMISASHNPPEYNAFKLIGKKAVQLSSDTGIKEIEKIVKKADFSSKKNGKISKKNILSYYIKHHLKFAKGIKGLKIVVDYGNAVGAVSAIPLFEKLDIKVVNLYEAPDGRFPNHLANPHDLKNLKDLQKRVKKEKADIGFFFDGDADRALVVDEKGEIVMPDLLLALFLEHELKGKKGERVYYDLRFSQIISEKVRECGGVPVMMRVGNPFYKEKLIKEGGVLAVEFSGHIMFKKNYGIDDGLFAVIKILKILYLSKRKFSELVAPFKKYYSSEEISIKVKDADETLRKVKDSFKDGKSIDIDGLYIKYSDWWFNLRKSMTEPLVRLRLEANTKELMEKKKKELVWLIGKN